MRIRPTPLILLLALILVAPAAADMISVPVDSGMVMAPPASGVFDLPFTDLNGIPLDGQLMALDLVFADSILARVLLTNELAVLLIVQTDAGTFPGFAGPDPTGWLIAPDGTPIQEPMDAARAMGLDGSFSVGLVGITPAMLDNAADLEGVHFDLRLPDTGFVVTGAKVRWAVSAPSTIQFGTAAQLPEPATALLLGSGLLGGAWWYRQRRSATPRR